MRHTIFIFLALTSVGLQGQEQATIAVASIPLYSEMSTGSPQVGVLYRDELVAIKFSITGSDGNWCSVTQIIAAPKSGEGQLRRAKSGQVPCHVLRRQNMVRLEPVAHTSLAETTPRVPLTVVLDSSFDPAVRKDLSTVAADVGDITADLFGHASAPLQLPIVCTIGPTPRTFIDSWSHPERFIIHVTVQGRGYAQFVYQLSHELGHVMLGAYRSDSTIETVASAVSLEVLDRIYRKWQSNPPYPSWQSYTEQFHKYRQIVESEALETTGLEALWRYGDLTGIKLTLRHANRGRDTEWTKLEDHMGRGLQTVGAMLLISSAPRWSDFVGIDACTNPSPTVMKEFRDEPLVRDCVGTRAPSLQELLPSP